MKYIKLRHSIVLFVSLFGTAPVFAGLSYLLSITVGGVCLVGAAITGKEAKSEYNKATGRSIKRAVQNQLRDNPRTQEEEYVQVVEDLSQRYGKTFGWGTATVVLGAVGLKLVLSGIQS